MKEESRIKQSPPSSILTFCSSNSLNHFCYDLKLNSGYNLGKDLNKSEGDNQLVKYKDTELYMLINHEETRRYSERKQWGVSKKNMRRLLLHEVLTDKAWGWHKEQ